MWEAKTDRPAEGAKWGQMGYNARNENGLDTNAKVLVADDEKTIANTLAAILNNAGFEALAVYDGKAAVDAVISFKPDILISDVMMPHMSGIEAAIAIMEQCPSCKVVLFSGVPATADLLEAAQAQGHRFEILGKPFHPTVLLEKLASLGFSPNIEAPQTSSKDSAVKQIASMSQPPVFSESQ